MFYDSTRNRILIIAAAVVGVILLCTGIFFFFPIKPRQEEFVFEAGEEISTDVTDYLSGPKLISRSFKMDMSDVDKERAASYLVFCKRGTQTKKFTITVSDKFAPTISTIPDKTAFAIGEYDAEGFVTESVDATRYIEKGFIVDGSKVKTIKFEEPGETKVTVYVADESGNTAQKDVTIFVATPPRILGVVERTFIVDREYGREDILMGQVVIDDIDGIISDKMEYDVSNVDFTSEGEYEMTISVTDAAGISAEKSIKVNVCTEEEYYIRSSSRLNSDVEISKADLDLIAASDYYSYEPLTEPDPDKIKKMIEPSLLNMNGNYITGSAVIYDITDEFVYGLSVEHVIDEVGSKCKIVLWTNVRFDTVLEYIVDSKSNELCMFRFPVSDVPPAELLTLKKICVDPTVYQTIKEGEPAIMYAPLWLSTQEAFEIGRVGSLISKEKDARGYLETEDTNFQPGTSGTAVVNQYGVLIGLVSRGYFYKDGSYLDYSARYDNLYKLREKLDSVPYIYREDD